jgi:hypothetical protein
MKNIFLKYPNEYFIETGSYMGDGISLAIEAKFKNIISIELSENFFNFCSEKFKSNKNVNLLLGDSEIVLKDTISNIDKPITFWLDGHYSACGTAFGLHESPLMQELDIIKEHHVKTHTIIIDDLRCWVKPQYEFDVSDLITKLREINEEYEISYEDGYVENDVLVAQIKQHQK